MAEVAMSSTSLTFQPRLGHMAFQYTFGCGVADYYPELNLFQVNYLHQMTRPCSQQLATILLFLLLSFNIRFRQRSTFKRRPCFHNRSMFTKAFTTGVCLQKTLQQEYVYNRNMFTRRVCLQWEYV